MICSEHCRRVVFDISSLEVDVLTIQLACCLGNCKLILSAHDPCRIYPQPLLLALHFYAVALYSIFLLFRKANIVSYPRTVVKGFEVLAKACVVFIPVVISELLP